MTEIEQLQDLIRQMNEHKAGMQQKVEERTQKVVDVNEKIQQMTKHIEELKSTVASQELSVADLSRLENEQKGLSEALERVLNQKDQKLKSLSAAQEELVSTIGELDEAVSAYNDSVAALALHEDLRSISVGMKARVVRDKLLGDEREYLGIECSEVISSLDTCVKSYREKVESEKARYQDSLDDLEKAKETLQEVEHKVSILKEKLARTDENLNQEKETHDAKLSVRRREVQSMEEKIASMRDPVALEEQMASYERQCAELEALIARHQEENIARKKATEDEIARAMMMMQEHQIHLRKKVTELHEYMARKKAVQLKLKLPDTVDVNGST